MGWERGGEWVLVLFANAVSQNTQNTEYKGLEEVGGDGGWMEGSGWVAVTAV